MTATYIPDLERFALYIKYTAHRHKVQRKNGTLRVITKPKKGGYIVFTYGSLDVKMRINRQIAYVENNFTCGCCNRRATHYSIEKDNPENRFWTSRLYVIVDEKPFLYSMDEEYGLLCDDCKNMFREKAKAIKCGHIWADDFFEWKSYCGDFNNGLEGCNK